MPQMMTQSPYHVHKTSLPRAMPTKQQTCCVLSSGATLSLFVLSLMYSTPKSIQWHNPLPTPNLNYIMPWSGQSSTFDGIGFLVMTSSATIHLHSAQRQTFLRGAQNVWAFADAPFPPIARTLSSLEGRPTWNDAQHRQLLGGQYLIEKNLIPGDIKWVFFIDDDTWVNGYALRGFLNAFKPLPASFVCGHHWESNYMLNGGAGILMGRGVFDTVVPRLYTPECPFQGTNDNTLTICVRTIPNATILHSRLFSFYPAHIDSTNDYMEQITMHQVKDPELMRQMTDNAHKFYTSYHRDSVLLE